MACYNSNVLVLQLFAPLKYNCVQGPNVAATSSTSEQYGQSTRQQSIGQVVVSFPPISSTSAVLQPVSQQLRPSTHTHRCGTPTAHLSEHARLAPSSSMFRPSLDLSVIQGGPFGRCEQTDADEPVMLQRSEVTAFWLARSSSFSDRQTCGEGWWG